MDSKISMTKTRSVSGMEIFNSVRLVEPSAIA